MRWAGRIRLFDLEVSCQVDQRDGPVEKVRCIEIVFAGNSNQREQGIASGIGEGSAHLVGRRRFADRADRPVGRYPFPGRMGENRGQADSPASSIVVVGTVAISCLPNALRTMSSPLESEA